MTLADARRATVSLNLLMTAADLTARINQTSLKEAHNLQRYNTVSIVYRLETYLASSSPLLSSRLPSSPPSKRRKSVPLRPRFTPPSLGPSAQRPVAAPLSRVRSSLTTTGVGSTESLDTQKWDATIFPDPATRAANCALDGASYSSAYSVTTSGNALTLNFVTGTNEFTFTVDLSTLPCGLNSALYFSEMPADGGASAYPINKAGAQHGIGYGDSQRPHNIMFINGAANPPNWTATSSNPGTEMYDTCCSEMDIWEANYISAAVSPTLAPATVSLSV
ncbi:hypothetical protein FRB98_001008 [Tulasnella sp. 332]|nr:hypothetical protein FRB98_001008 [Tulasnella sp. 332]